MHDTDRRVIFTRKLLRSSLLKLMAEKPISRISVTELCKGAGVNRGTFYSHYRQPEDVLIQIEDELIAMVREILETGADTAYINQAVAKILYANRDACRMIIGKNGDPECINRMKVLSDEYFIERTKEFPALNKEETRYLRAFMFSGTVSLLGEWLNSDAPCSPEEIAEAVTTLHRRITRPL